MAIGPCLSLATRRYWSITTANGPGFRKGCRPVGQSTQNGLLDGRRVLARSAGSGAPGGCS